MQRPHRIHRVRRQPQPLSQTSRDHDSSSDAWRHANIGRLLNNAVRRFESRVFELLSGAGRPEARLTHLNLTRNLDVAGTRITELACRAEMTKQAMGELVVQCEDLGLVRRESDPTDARAKIVKFTSSGLEWLAAFKSALERAEREMRRELGTLCVDGLAAALTSYAADYDPLGSKPQAGSARKDNWRF